MGLRIREKIIKCRTLYYRIIKKVYFGHGTSVFGQVEFNGANISFGDNNSIRAWSCFKSYGGYIKIGNNCSINSFCHFSGNGGITIGNDVLIATQCVLISANHNFDDSEKLIRMQGETQKPIDIEDNCWLGAGVKVLAGVTIHKGSVVGAGAVVTHDLPAYSVSVGVPARVINMRR
jgi:acetyltransferase-like isoleucine patch superfamily enzyme